MPVSVNAAGTELTSDLGVITKCEKHDHIRQCVMEEVDRVIAGDEVRFQFSMKMFFAESRRRIQAQRYNPHAATAAAEQAANRCVHDPRLRQLAESYMSKRRSIPIRIDAMGLPEVCPTEVGGSQSLDMAETLRLIMDVRDSVHLESERLRVSARSAHLLMQATVRYVRALRCVCDKTEGPSRAIYELGLRAVMRAETKARLLATHAIQAYQEEWTHARQLVGDISWRLSESRALIDSEQARLNEDVMTTAAIAANMSFLDASLTIACHQSARPEEPFPFEIPDEDVDDALANKDMSTLTWDEAKAYAVHKFIVVRRALEAARAQCLKEHFRLKISFYMYPYRDNGVTVFYIDDRAHRELSVTAAGEQHGEGSTTEDAAITIDDVLDYDAAHYEEAEHARLFDRFGGLKV